jgi:hypothetical protein
MRVQAGDLWSRGESNLILSDIGRILGEYKKVIALCFLLLVIGMSLIPGLIWMYVDMSKREVLYQSPLDGEPVVIGEWIHGGIEIEPPPPDLENWIAISLDVKDWNQCNYTLDMVYGCASMTLPQYLTLNSTERDAIFRNRVRFISQNRPYTSESSSTISTLGTHVWALKLVGSFKDIPSYAIKVLITVSVIHQSVPMS